jgi:hypothetical protein
MVLKKASAFSSGGFSSFYTCAFRGGVSLRLNEAQPLLDLLKP